MSSVNEVMGSLKKKTLESNPKVISIKDMGTSKLYNNYVDEKDRGNPPTWVQNFRNYFSEYCSTSGIHGVRYLGERGRFLVEKLSWTIVIILVWYGCIILILKAYDKWVTSPVIVTFATRETAIYEIPFPAVTICPEIKTDPEIFNFTRVYMNKFNNRHITPDENQYYESFSLICVGLDGEVEGNEKFHSDNLTITSRVLDDLINAFPVMPRNKTRVRWLGDTLDFNDAVSRTFTSEGLCYSFNMLDFEDILVDGQVFGSKCSKNNTRSKMWTLEEGYPRGDKIDTYPLRTFIPGLDGGFEMDIYTNHSHVDYLCKDSLQGFKITLHHPSELPNMDRHFRLPLDQAVLVAVKPRMIKVTQEVKSYKAKDRQCYFAKERKLTFFKTYTQQNCLAECLSNYTFLECGCVAFYMPKFEVTPICGPGSKECLKSSKISYLVNQAEFQMNARDNNQESGCNCMPSCTSLEYDVEISQTNWNWENSYRVFESETGMKDNQFDYKMSHVSKLAVYYREMQFLSSERHEVYGFVDFFSNIGGLLGLFIGFSVTSAFEILYFLTLRILCNIKKFGRNFWAGQQQNN